MVQHKRPDYVQIVTDRYGKQHLYFRHPRKPREKLPGPMYSEPFWTAISLKQGRYHAVVERTVSWDNFSYFDGYFRAFTVLRLFALGPRLS